MELLIIVVSIVVGHCSDALSIGNQPIQRLGRQGEVLCRDGKRKEKKKKKKIFSSERKQRQEAIRVYAINLPI